MLIEIETEADAVSDGKQFQNMTMLTEEDSD